MKYFKRRCDVMTYKVTVITKAQNRKYGFEEVETELVKNDYEHNKHWYVLKNKAGEYMAKFDLYDVECVYYPRRLKCNSD